MSWAGQHRLHIGTPLVACIHLTAPWLRIVAPFRRSYGKALKALVNSLYRMQSTLETDTDAFAFRTWHLNHSFLRCSINFACTPWFSRLQDRRVDARRTGHGFWISGPCESGLGDHEDASLIPSAWSVTHEWACILRTRT